METLSRFYRGSSVEMNVFLIHEIFYNCRKKFNLRNKITIQIDNELCSMETCYVCRNDKYETIKNGPLIGLRLVRKCNAKTNED